MKHFNREYFDTIDTEGKAYFFGLLLSDGSNNQRLGVVELALSAGDVAILEAFKREIGFQRPIRIQERGIGNDGIYRQPRARLTLCGKSFSKSLAAIGCVQRKSLIVTWPSCVREDLERHFIRGYFDGNGCIFKNDCSPYPAQHSVSFSSTRPFCERVQQILNRECGALGNLERSQCSAPIYSLRYSGNGVAETIGHYLYRGAEFYLERKRHIFDGITPRDERDAHRSQRQSEAAHLRYSA